ncbi:hypothetical protein D9758_016351 [Tetrapyrgos nigripes]|uniref:IRG-type G domain-containing protein n=1 Tax=Tetrapyrgos nigripes TaxID=182062 RepID=A0A8H5BXM1_9AGAR|nr:hypothetical protein D9758_016351 [Tetrapyrgos nigripes]
MPVAIAIPRSSTPTPNSNKRRASRIPPGSLTDVETDTDRSVTSKSKSIIPDRVLSILRGRKRGEGGRRTSIFFPTHGDDEKEKAAEKENEDPRGHTQGARSSDSGSVDADRNESVSLLESTRKELQGLKEENARLEARLTEKERDLEGMNRLNEDNEKLRGELEELKQGHAVLMKKDEERTETLEALATSLKEKDNEVERLTTALDEMKKALDIAEANKREAQELLGEKETLLEDAVVARDKLVSELQEAKNKIAELGERLAHVVEAEKRLTQVEGELTQEKASREREERARQLVEREAQEARDAYDEEFRKVDEELRGAWGDLDEVKAEKAEWENEKAQYEEERKEKDVLKEEMEALRARYENEQEEKAKLEEGKQELLALIATYKTEASTATAALEHSKTHFDDASSVISEYQARLNGLSLLLQDAQVKAQAQQDELDELENLGGLKELKERVETEQRGREDIEERLREADERVKELLLANTEIKDREEKTRDQLRRIIAQNLSGSRGTSTTAPNNNGIASPQAPFSLSPTSTPIRSTTPLPSIPNANPTRSPTPTLTPGPREYDALRKARKFKDGFLHFAVVGSAGCGKSSLVNAFRGVLNATSTAAPTGLQTELTTTTIGRYPDPRRDCRIIWYDVPGSGSASGGADDYFTRQGLYVFDCICLVWDTRLTITDMAVLESCVRLRIPVFLVRTKSDVHLNDLEDVMRAKIEADLGNSGVASGSEKEREKRKVARLNSVPADALGRYITQTRQSVDMSLRKAKLPPVKAYLVSCRSVLKLVQSGQSGYGGGAIPDGVKVIDERDLMADIVAQRRMRK